MDSRGRKSINKAGLMWAVAALLLLIMATPALSTIFAAPGSINAKAIVKGAVTSAKIKDKTIKNADIAAGAAIAATKINRAGLDADLLDGKQAADFVQKTGDQAMGGALTAANYRYGPPKTRTLTLSPFDLIPAETSNTYSGLMNGYLYSVSGVNFQAPIHLPQGAKITNIRYWLYNNKSGGEIWGQMWRETRATGGFSFEEASRVQLTANSTDWAVLDDASISSPVIDNDTNTYMIQVKFWDSDTDVRFGGAVITYEIQGP